MVQWIKTGGGTLDKNMVSLYYINVNEHVSGKVDVNRRGKTIRSNKRVSLNVL